MANEETVTFQDVPAEVTADKSDMEPGIIVLNFADAAVPIFKEKRNKDYIEYGDKNNYAEELTHLYNKSGKHNAIITGKAKYIFGKGYENGDMIVNRSNDSLNDIARKSILDVEIYGGWRWEVIWNRNGKIAEIYHVDWNCLRKAKEGGFLFKENWGNQREDAQPVCAFDPAEPIGSQIYEYVEYRPGVRYYPLPGYIGCINYIRTDIEISIYYLSAISNGMMPSKMIQFFKGDPPDEKKKAIERRFANKFSGAGNAGKFIMVFNDGNSAKSVEINDLSDTNADKMFIELNKATQQEILSGHGVTSPMLFGIKTEGQLGGTGELQVAYSIFQNTYAEPKANAFDKEVNWLMGFSNFPGEYKLQPTDPIGLQFDIKDVIQGLPKAFVFDELGIPEELWNGPSIGGGTAQPMNTEIVPNAQAVNDNIKNLTGKQKQNIDRIVRQYENPNHPMTRAQAAMMLKKGYGLDDEDVIAFLGEEPAPLQMSFEDNEEAIIEMFDECGDSKNDFEIVKSRKVSFSENAEDEEIFMQEAFKTLADLTASESKIVELIRKDPKITPEVLAAAIGETKKFVVSKLTSLVKRGYIETSTEMIGLDEIITRAIPKGIDFKFPPTKINPTQIFVKYSYEGPQDSRNRPFCAKMMQLNRLYTRADIEKISERLGYSVFDRRGGFWNKGNGVISPSCRHFFKSNIVIKKGGKDVS